MTTGLSKQPALFIGHGSPMNIAADNQYTKDLIRLRGHLGEPAAILVVSAHWLTHGTLITSGSHPEQIYDFYGFPSNLYEVKYQAPGFPETAEIIVDTVGENIISPDKNRGIDHAAWAVLKHIYPEQKIPVLEISLDMEKEPGFHFELGQKLAKLREMNILVIGSGNIIHNLYEVDFNEYAVPFSWALELDSIIKKKIETRDFGSLINHDSLGKDARRAFPTIEHYLPMLCSLGMLDENENISFFHDSIQNGSVSMRSFISH